MASFILNDRYYHILGQTHDESNVASHKVKYVETEFGLLMYNSPSNFRSLRGIPRREHEARLETNFVVINSVHGTITIVEPTGRRGEEAIVARRYTRNEIRDIGDPILAISGPAINMFVGIMLSEGRSPRDVFEALAKSMVIGSDTDAFIANADGIPLDDLFKHPFANKDFQF